MRIALLTDDWRPTGGVASYVRLLAPALADAGHEVLVVHDGLDTDTGAASSTFTVTAVTAAFRARSHELDTDGAMQVGTHVASFAPDIVHLHANANTVLERQMQQHWPTVRTVHGLETCPAGSKLHGVTGRICTLPTGPMCLPRLLYLRCTDSLRPAAWLNGYRSARTTIAALGGYSRVIVASRYMRGLVEQSALPSDRLDVVPCCTADAPPAPAAASRTVLFVGRVNREKGADQLLEIMARVTGSWRLVIVGDGIGMPALQDHIRRSPYAERIECRGWLTGAALDAAYAEAAVVVMPSRWPEPFGLVGLEAMMRERPVVAYDVGGIADWLDDGVGGYLVPPGDIAGMASRIQQVLDDPHLAAEVAQRGRARVRAEFTVGPHLARLMPTYERVVARN